VQQQRLFIARAENRDDVIPEEAAVAQPQPQRRRLHKAVVDILSGLEGGTAEDNNEEVAQDDVDHDDNLLKMILQMEIGKYRKKARLSVYYIGNDAHSGYTNPLL
jgi:hypothetical protein